MFSAEARDVFAFLSKEFDIKGVFLTENQEQEQLGTETNN